MILPILACVALTYALRLSGYLAGNSRLIASSSRFMQTLPVVALASLLAPLVVEQTLLAVVALATTVLSRFLLPDILSAVAGFTVFLILGGTYV
ncbi:AzlD domain-containing protein [Phaeobacter inhibens]|uniref:AzlD domain-containing protein n=1 Tax=Phaeobacter inhibens TaxID=221822 RepID=UPI0034677484